MEYQLLDSGDGKKLEQFGEVILVRPAAQAVWRPKLSKKKWDSAHARFSRTGKNEWEIFKPIPSTWEMQLANVRLKLKRTDFGHLGVFPEHSRLWTQLYTFPLKDAKILNLFAYSGAATLALSKQGALVTHLDASKGMVQWARENAAINGLENAPIRWIVDDVCKYLARALRRKEKYDAILLDPPSFGRGKSGEVFKIERDLFPILEQCSALLSAKPLFVLLTSHTPGYTPISMKQVLHEVFPEGNIDSGEMLIEGTEYALPCGTYALWRK